MRVVLVGSYFPPYVGGIEGHMADLAAALGDAGASVSVACLFAPPRLGPRRIDKVGGILVQRVGALSFGDNVVWPSRLVKDQSVDVVHFHGFSRPLLLRAVLDASKARLVVTTHGGVGGTAADNHNVRRSIKRAFDRTAGGPLLRRAARIIALTTVEANHLVSHLGIARSKIAVMPNPLPSRSLDLHPASPGESRRLVVLSRLSPEKRIGDLMAALQVTARAIGCDIAGPDGGDEQRLRLLSSRLEPGRVRFLGYVSGLDKQRLLRSAEALVLPSATEGLSISALEAIAQGTPVIASDSACNGLPPEACMKYPVGEVAALATCIDSLADPKVISRLRRAALTARNQIDTISDYTARLMTIYQEALEPPVRLAL